MYVPLYLDALITAKEKAFKFSGNEFSLQTISNNRITIKMYIYMFQAKCFKNAEKKKRESKMTKLVLF